MIGPLKGSPNRLSQSVFCQHECFMNHVYITHFAGCAVLLNSGTFHSDIWVNSVDIHDTRTGQQQVVKEGQSSWVLQAVISRASSWRIPRNANSDFTHREPPSSTCTSTRSSTTSSIQSFQQRITRHDWSSWKHRIVWTTRCGTRSTVQSMSVVLGRRHSLLRVRALLARWIGWKQEIRQAHSWPLFDSQLLHQERATPRTPLREEARGSRVLHREFAQEEMQEKEISWIFTTDSSATRSSARTCLTLAAMKKYVVRWTNWRTRITHTTLLQKKLVYIETIGGSVRILLVPTRCP